MCVVESWRRLSRRPLEDLYDRPVVTTPTFGAGEGTRTLNLRITNPLLYQLSYASPAAVGA